MKPSRIVRCDNRLTWYHVADYEITPDKWLTGRFSQTQPPRGDMALTLAQNAVLLPTLRPDNRALRGKEERDFVTATFSLSAALCVFASSALFFPGWRSIYVSEENRVSQYSLDEPARSAKADQCVRGSFW